MDESVILYTTWPDAETAEAFAAEAVAEGLAACANILSPMVAVYRWKGAVDRAAETPMVLKTTLGCAAALRDLVLARHPYEVPCVLALRIDAALSSAPYLQWLASEVSEPSRP